MMFWNSLDIRGPPTQLCNVSTGVFRQTDLVQMKNAISSAYITLKNLSQFHSEAALLSRILYKQKTRFRHHQAFKKLEKVNRGLLKYLAFDLASVYSKFGKLLPECPEDFEFAVPSRQILEWVLVTTQGFAKLFCVIADTCEETACYWKCNIQLGHLCNMSLVIMGVLGRIWSYAKFLVQNACNWFAELRQYLTILKPKGVAWLPQGYEVPKDLKTWLKSPHITNSTTEVKSLGDNKNKMHIFDLIDQDDSTMSDSETPYITNDDFPLVKNGDEPSRKKIKTETLTTYGKPLTLSNKMNNLGKVVPRNIVETKNNIWPLARSVGIEDVDEEVPRLDTRTEIHVSKKRKKQRYDCSSREDIGESQFDSDSKSGKVVGSELDSASERRKDKKKKRKREEKKQKHLPDSSEEVKSDRLEITDDTELSTKNNGSAYEPDTKTGFHVSKKRKKQRHDCSSREDIGESQFDPDSKSGKIVESKLDSTSERRKDKKKKQKHLLDSSEEVKSDRLEITDDTELSIKNNGSGSEHESNPSESERKVTTSKRKRKKKSKVNRQVSLMDALLENYSKSKHNSTCANQQLLKQSKKKKKKGKNQQTIFNFKTKA